MIRWEFSLAYPNSSLLEKARASELQDNPGPTMSLIILAWGGDTLQGK